MRGRVADRLVVRWGSWYVASSRSLTPADAVPDWFLPLRDRAEALAGVAFDQVMLTWYRGGSGIGPHVDAPAFGSPIAGFGLGRPCRMVFGDPDLGRRSVSLAPRDLYLLDGPARSDWSHEIPRTSKSEPDRYGVTLRPVLARVADGQAAAAS